MQAYSTDGEEALRQCKVKVHLMRNIEDKCHHMSEASTTQIVNDIFGSDGLVNAQTKEEYSSKFDLDVRQKWDNLERMETDQDPKFSTYLEQHKLHDVWNHSTLKVLLKFRK